MAINVLFGGANIYVPGAYSTKNVILTGAIPSVAVGKVAIIGESTNGPAGSLGIMQFSPQALGNLLSMYGSGPICDAARQLVNPSNDSRITSGASSIYVYKTNPSSQASLTLAPSFGTLTSLGYGQTANLTSVTVNKQNAIDATTVSSATFNSTSALSGGAQFSIRVSGGAVSVFTLPASIVTSRATLTSALANAGYWSPSIPTGVTFLVGGNTDAAATLTVSEAVLSTDNTLGYGRTFELITGTPDMLAIVNLSAGLKVALEEESIELIASNASLNINEDTNNLNGNLGGVIYMKIGYAGTTASLTINATQMVITAVGGVGAGLVLQLSNYTTLNSLASYINAQPGYTCSIPAGVNGGLSPQVLDKVTAMGLASTGAALQPGEIKADYYSVYSYLLANSQLISLANVSNGVGLPNQQGPLFLSGAILGASSSSSFINGLDALEGIDDVDLIVPLISQDATNDIIEQPGYTDPSSTYTAASILFATNAHCALMSNTQNRKERVCYLGFRGTFPQCIAQSLVINSAYASLLIQDVEVLLTNGNLGFLQPHIAASLCAGMQAGADIGQPTTKKLIQAAAIRHVGQAAAPLSGNNLFDPKTSLAQAISNGIMPLNNPSTGGVEIVVQNATYSVDSNFVYNRPSVFSAVNYIAKVLRTDLEDKFVGTKNQTSTPDSIESEVIAVMADFLRSNIIVGDDTNKGTGWKNISINDEGDSVTVGITITPVQGVDFILLNLAFDNIRISQ